MGFIKKLFFNFGELTRVYALPVTLASCILIWAFAKYNESFTYLNFGLLVLALCCVHLGANLFDDYVDTKKKLKVCGSLENISFDRFALKANLILNRTFSFKEVRFVIFMLFLIATCIGIHFAINVSIYVLIYALIGGVFALFYPIAPKFCLGEIIIGLIYGPLMINGGYLALTGEFNYNLFLCSVAVFFTAIVLLHTDNLMDWEHDIAENKKTLCIISGSKLNAIKWLKIAIFCSYAIVVAAVLLGCFNPKTFYVFLTLPIAVKLPASLNDYINIRDIDFQPRWYYGPFENWKKIKAARIDFFMYRMYLARNYLFFFALFLAIGAITGNCVFSSL
ncbi:MAG: prenyltransferase [Candidatus Gastranaerophilales bacterium]|nr:prenyltransferase [Candidatus Gastranaerophilales bacterium]